MSILIDKNSRLLVQGITGGEGSLHAKLCKEYGTNVVAGVTPGREGQQVEGVPVFNTIAKAVKETGANASIIFVPAAFATDAIFEALEAGIALVVVITEGIPTADMVAIHRYTQLSGQMVIGPNCPGLISPGKAKAGIMPADAFMPGRVGMVTRSGTLLYESAAQLTTLGIGQTTCVGIGGDPVPGTNFVDMLERFNSDPETDAIVLIGEIGGVAEQEAAEYIKEKVRKPMVGFVAGVSAPPGRRMGHAGAIITGSAGTASEKLAALERAGVVVTRNPGEIGVTMQRVLRK
ncbi:MAG: succinate--CoA ligase subunit alpha [Dehalococcoidia bacterium]|nr:succinate--CoA ligase subunit alpha [Dehalococcoidia bacterium]